MQESQLSSALPGPKGKSRGKLILALGILSLVLIPVDIIAGFIIFAGRYSYDKFHLFFSIMWLTILLAPILGISTWLMANKDLRKIRDGIVHASARGVTKTGKILGILSTFVAPPLVFIILIAISMYTVCAIPCNKDAMINDLNNLSAHAYQYSVRSLEKGGGGGSYEGYKLPQKLADNENAIYTVAAIYRDSLILHGWSKQVDGTIEVKIDRTGRPTGAWTYGGNFQ